MRVINAYEPEKRAARVFALNLPRVRLLNESEVLVWRREEWDAIVSTGRIFRFFCEQRERGDVYRYRWNGDFKRFAGAVSTAGPRHALAVRRARHDDGDEPVELGYVYSLFPNYIVQTRRLELERFGVPQSAAVVVLWAMRLDVFNAGARHDWPKSTHIEPAGVYSQPTLFGPDLPAYVTIGEVLEALEPLPERYAGPRVTSSGRPVLWNKRARRLKANLERGEVKLTIELPAGPIVAPSIEDLAALQTAPEGFKLPDDLPRAAVVRIVCGSWPSSFAAAFARALSIADPPTKTALDFFAGGGLGTLGIHGKYWHR